MGGVVPLLAVLLAAIAVSAFLDAPRARAFPQKLTPDNSLSPSDGVGDMVVLDNSLDGHGYLVLSNRETPSGNGSVEVYTRSATTSGYRRTPDAPLPVPKHERMLFDDVNNDTRPDVILLTSPPERVLVYLQPVGGFPRLLPPPLDLPVPGAIDIATGALLGDPSGRLPIVVVYPGMVKLYPPIPTPFDYFEGSNVTLGNSSGYGKAAVSDVDRDGNPDLVLAVQSEMKVFYGRAFGGIGSTCAYPECRTYAAADNPSGQSTILVGDVTSDGRSDLVMAVSNGATHNATLSVFAQAPQLRNFARVFWQRADFTGQFTLADLNGDGRTDIAAILYSGGRVVFFYQRPGGTFENRVDLQLNGTGPSGHEADESVASVDLNGDGYRDLALRAVTTATPAPAIRSKVSFFLQEDFPVEPVDVIPPECPKCYHFNQDTVAIRLIDLSKYFQDDHGEIIYDITYQENPQNLTAALDGHYLDFVPKPGWYGVSKFRVSGNDGGIGHVAYETANFSVMVNAIPRIAGDPPAQVHVGEEYRYLPSVDDPFPLTDPHTFTLVQAPPGTSLDVNSGLLRWNPTTIGNYTFSIRVADAFGGASQEKRFSVEVLAAIVTAPDTNIIPFLKDTNGLIVTGATFGALIFVAVLVVVNENVKYGALLFLLPLYSKIKREKVLDHFIRGQIYGYVMANPGEHYNAIKQALEITNGSLAHHLKTLEREQFVKSKRFGLYRRFYPWAMRVPEDGYFQLNEIQKNILDLCRHQPGVSQKEISASLRLTPPTINYHIAILAEHGYISVVRRGRKTHVYVIKGGNDEAGRKVSH